MRPSRFLLLVLPLAAACGPATPSGDPDAGTPAGTPDPAYFGLVDDRCLLFTNDLSVHIEKNDVAISGKSVFTMTYGQQGFPIQVDYVEPTGAGLVLHRRDESVAGGDDSFKTVWRFTDGPVVLTKELAVGEPIESTTATIREKQGTPQENFSAVLKSEMLDESVVTAGGQEFTTQRVIFSILKDSVPERTDRLWFSAQHGLVKVDLHGTDLKESTFTQLKTLDPTASGTARFCMKD